MMMIILTAIMTSILSMLVLFFLTKLTGNKQISQMSMFDYIAGITIGSSAAEMAIGGDAFIPAAVATVLYGFAAFMISYICNKSVRARRFLNGEPLILFKNGVFYKDNMARVRMDMGEFLTQCRTNGTFTLSDIFCVIMESNGKISVMKKQISRASGLAVNLIIDGRMIEENLARIGKDREWLEKELSEKKVRAENIMLAALEDGKLALYPISNENEKNHLFE